MKLQVLDSPTVSSLAAAVCASRSSLRVSVGVAQRWHLCGRQLALAPCSPSTSPLTLFASTCSFAPVAGLRASRNYTCSLALLIVMFRCQASRRASHEAEDWTQRITEATHHSRLKTALDGSLSRLDATHDSSRNPQAAATVYKVARCMHRYGCRDDGCSLPATRACLGRHKKENV